MKDIFKKEKGEKLRQQRAQRAYKKAFGQFKCVVIAQQSCGCCNTHPMHFRDEASCKAAFAAAALQVSADITDDAGTVHTSVDTFYGYRHPDNTEVRSLGYLAAQLGMKMRG